MSVDCVKGRTHDDNGYDRGECMLCHGAGCAPKLSEEQAAYEEPLTDEDLDKLWAAHQSVAARRLITSLRRQRADFDTLRRAVAHVVQHRGPLSMYATVTRDSTSANGGQINAGRWWWVLRAALEKTWERYGNREALERGEEPWEP